MFPRGEVTDHITDMPFLHAKAATAFSAS